MKKIFSASMLAVTALFCVNANAQAVGNVAVNVNLAPKCQINSVATGIATITAINIVYESFQATAANANSSFVVRCTNGLTFGMGLDAGPGNVRGINYFSALGGAVATGLTAEGLPLSGLVGAGAGTTYYVNTTAPLGQAGNSAVATAQTRVVTVTF